MSFKKLMQFIEAKNLEKIKESQNQKLLHEFSEAII